MGWKNNKGSKVNPSANPFKGTRRMSYQGGGEVFGDVAKERYGTKPLAEGFNPFTSEDRNEIYEGYSPEQIYRQLIDMHPELAHDNKQIDEWLAEAYPDKNPTEVLPVDSRIFMFSNIEPGWRSTDYLTHGQELTNPRVQELLELIDGGDFDPKKNFEQTPPPYMGYSEASSNPWSRMMERREEKGEGDAYPHPSIHQAAKSKQGAVQQTLARIFNILDPEYKEDFDVPWAGSPAGIYPMHYEQDVTDVVRGLKESKYQDYMSKISNILDEKGIWSGSSNLKKMILPSTVVKAGDYSSIEPDFSSDMYTYGEELTDKELNNLVDEFIKGGGLEKWSDFEVEQDELRGY